MLTPVSVGNKSLADYTHLVGRPLVQEIRDLAEDLKGRMHFGTEPSASARQQMPMA